MKYFSYLADEDKKQIFYKEPEEFFIDDKSLAYTLGGLLYTPATREGFARMIIDNKNKNLVSLALCLEDAIGDLEIKKAKDNICKELKILNEYYIKNPEKAKSKPLIFIRVREPWYIMELSDLLGESIYMIEGFILPKINTANIEAYTFEIQKLNREHESKKFYALPIIESKEVMNNESRRNSLCELARNFDKYKEYILNIRIGTTDFSGLFGLRRTPEETIYDLTVVRSCVDDIINFFARIDRQYVISGSVWEYFSEDMIDPKLANFIKEVKADIANGLIGKTVIHPIHLKYIQGLLVVSKANYLDALDILKNNNGEIGVMKSRNNDKMNEIKPHNYWAKKIIERSRIYGVYNEGKDYRDLVKR